jgi:23S rRNA G2445 N2-methylase RlmL
MCGSGTLAIEAACVASARAPGLTRDNFAFMHLLTFEQNAWDRLKEDALKVVAEKCDSRIIATDINGEAVKAARKNAAAAGVDKLIEWGTSDFSETPVPEQPGVVIFNPEYGIRTGNEKELEPTYQKIGDFLKKKCAGYQGYIFTANERLASRVGLKHRRKEPFFSGKIPCWLYAYELYKGRKV